MIKTTLKNMIIDNSNIWIGIGISIVIVLLLFGIIVYVNNSKKPSILSVGVGLLLVPFLSFQMSRLYGAIEVIDMLDTADETMSSVTAAVSDLTGMDKKNTSNAMKLASKFVPGVSQLFDVGSEFSNMSKDMIDKAYSFMYWYIARRVLWSLGFSILAAIGIVLTMDGGSTSRRRTSDRYERLASRRGDERRPGSRRSRK